MSEKFCPLCANPPENRMGFICLKQLCGWYNEATGNCAVLDLAHEAKPASRVAKKKEG